MAIPQYIRTPQMVYICRKILGQGGDYDNIICAVEHYCKAVLPPADFRELIELLHRPGPPMTHKEMLLFERIMVKAELFQKVASVGEAFRFWLEHSDVI